MVQAKWTGQNPYFTTKNLETNCKLEGLTISSPKASIWPILPSSQTQCDPGSSRVQRPAQSSLWSCFAAGHPHPACLQTLPSLGVNLYLPEISSSLAGGEAKETRWAPVASEQTGQADLKHQFGKAKEGEALFCWQQKSQRTVKASQGTSLSVCKGLAPCWHLLRFYIFTYLCQAIICIARKFPASHTASKWDLLFSKCCLRHTSQCL